MTEKKTSTENSRQPTDLPQFIIDILEEHELLYSKYEFREIRHIIEDTLPQWFMAMKKLYGKNFDTYLKLRLQITSKKTEEYSATAIRQFLGEALRDIELLVGTEYENVGEMIDTLGEKPLLSRDQEKELLLLKTDGDKATIELQNYLKDTDQDIDLQQFQSLDEKTIVGIAAKRELRDRNIRYVLELYLKKFIRYGTGEVHPDRGDLVLAGLEGLEIAISKFDPIKYDGSLLSYSTFWIRAKMQKRFQELNNIEVVGTSRIALKTFSRDIDVALDHFDRTFHRLPSVEEVHQFLVNNFGAKYRTYGQLIRRFLRGELLETEEIDNEKEENLASTESFEENDGQEDREIFDEMRKELGLYKARFSPNEEDLIRIHIAAAENQEEHPSLQSIANIMGVTRERVRQIKKKVIEKIAEYDTLPTLKKLFGVNVNLFELSTSQGKIDAREYSQLTSELLDLLDSELELLIRTNYLPNQRIEDSAVEFIQLLGRFFTQQNRGAGFDFEKFVAFYAKEKNTSEVVAYFENIKKLCVFCINILRANYQPEYAQYLNALVILNLGKRKSRKLTGDTDDIGE